MTSGEVPKRCIVISGVQRSGTSLLCEGLTATGMAGRPTEYFLPLSDPAWVEKKSGAEIRAFISQVVREGTTPNGIFGINIMWNTHCGAQETLGRLPEFSGCSAVMVYTRMFSDISYIWIRRRDRVRQAVSWARAAQTGQYRSYTPQCQGPTARPRFDY
jgi:LPS sulfotransferase NodH